MRGLRFTMKFNRNGHIKYDIETIKGDITMKELENKFDNLVLKEEYKRELSVLEQMRNEIMEALIDEHTNIFQSLRYITEAFGNRMSDEELDINTDVILQDILDKVGASHDYNDIERKYAYTRLKIQGNREFYKEVVEIVTVDVLKRPGATLSELVDEFEGFFYGRLSDKTIKEMINDTLEKVIV